MTKTANQNEKNKSSGSDQHETDDNYNNRNITKPKRNDNCPIAFVLSQIHATTACHECAKESNKHKNKERNKAQ